MKAMTVSRNTLLSVQPAKKPMAKSHAATHVTVNDHILKFLILIKMLVFAAKLQKIFCRLKKIC